MENEVKLSDTGVGLVAVKPTAVPLLFVTVKAPDNRPDVS